MTKGRGMNFAAWTTKPRQAILNAPILAKVIAIVVGMSLLLMVSIFWQVHGTWYRLAVRDLERRASIVADDLADDAWLMVRDGQHTALQGLVERIAQSSPEVDAVEIVDGRSAVLAGVGPLHPQASTRIVTVPLGKGVNGTVRVAFLDAGIAAEVRQRVRRLHATITGIALLGLAVSWWLTVRLTHPIHELIGVTRAVKQGDYTARAPVRATDEIGQLAEAFNDMTAALARKEQDRRLLLRRVIAAGEDERKRVARELHDQTGQTLTALIAGLSALEASPGARPSKDLSALAVQAYDEVHDLSRTLRPTVLDDMGLPGALQQHCRSFAERFGVRVDCDAVGIAPGTRLAAEVEVALYRIVQEALTNAVRHGKAGTIQVLLQRTDGHILAVIEDDGRGFDPQRDASTDSTSAHLGLLGIEERTALLGGRFRVESHPGGGAGLFVEIPIEEHPHG